jgi:hypothetical protein
MAALLLAGSALAIGACHSSVTDASGEGGAGPDTGTGGDSGGAGSGGSTSGAGGGAAAGAGGKAGASGGAGGAAGGGGKGGAGGTAGAGGKGGAGTGGATGTGGVPPATMSACAGSVKINTQPFGCKFAWGADNAQGLTSYLNFVATWIGDETRGGLDAALQTNVSCQDCQLVSQVASTNAMVVFYAYFIGFQACKQGGFCDCNTHPNQANLCTNGAQWIRDNHATIVKMYGEYAKKVYAASPNKPTIWWLEGDYIQYSDTTTQTNALSYTELGQLASEIVCAIKAGQPNAIVGMNHSPWIANDVANDFWSSEPTDVLDLVWTQGAGDTTFFPNSGSYNSATANYSWIHTKTGLPIMVETNYATAGQPDRWTTTTVANIDMRIAEGVIGVKVSAPASNYQSTLQSIGPLTICQ